MFRGTVLLLATQRVFNVTNAVRMLYNRDPLMWNDELARGAQQWADAMKDADPSKVAHEFDSENLFMGVNAPHIPPEKAVCHWLKEDGHRATLLSKEITHVGCGVATGRHSVVVCRYWPTPSSMEANVKSICPHILPYRERELLAA